MDVHLVFYRVKSEIVRLAERHPGFTPPPAIHIVNACR
jgi:hypothetical protein